ncbi:MAG: CDP-diacylglycerol--serine O-phosphatidyltransferase [Candidatus Cloacimonas sp. 4484_143]|nr:MAG: CDP-diacylglycerol--serine O-phosphatidyltransferase [Candidatus Cloacimonas sp. 4484_143]
MNKFTKYKILIPNFFTALSLILGLISLQFIFDGSFSNAAWLIGFSMICDFLDGKLARMLNAQTKFGALFDTLSDFVAFGVVPGFLSYKIGLNNFNILGAVVSLFYVFSGGYRLVRFTLETTDSKIKHPFIGLPIPAAAGLISSFILFNIYLWGNIKSMELLLVITFISSVLMISKIEYLSIDKGKKFSRETKFFISLAVISLVAAFRYHYIVFALWIVIYIFYGIVRHIIISDKHK